MSETAEFIPDSSTEAAADPSAGAASLPALLLPGHTFVRRSGQSCSERVFWGPISPAYFDFALDQIFGMLEAHSRGKTALPHTLATLHGSTPCKELADCKESQMLEGKQRRCATQSTTSPHSPEKPGEPRSCLQAAATRTQALGNLHRALAPAHS